MSWRSLAIKFLSVLRRRLLLPKFCPNACALRPLRIPMMSISYSDLMPISSERSDAGLSQCETVIDISQEFSLFSLLSWL